MAEAHSAVAFNFTVTHEGVYIDYDKEVRLCSTIQVTNLNWLYISERLFWLWLGPIVA